VLALLEALLALRIVGGYGTSIRAVDEAAGCEAFKVASDCRRRHTEFLCKLLDSGWTDLEYGGYGCSPRFSIHDFDYFIPSCLLAILERRISDGAVCAEARPRERPLPTPTAVLQPVSFGLLVLDGTKKEARAANLIEQGNPGDVPLGEVSCPRGKDLLT
jgi:hypothetical protein